MTSRRTTPRSNGRKLKREQLDLVVVDPAKLLWHRQRTALSKSAFADQMGIGRSSLYRMEDGIAVKRSTVVELADALGVAVEELLESTPVATSAEQLVSPWDHPEWEIVPGTLSPLRVMSNGLVMRVARVRHRVLEREFGRAKLYDIVGMPAAVRDQCRQALLRHAVVCRQLAGCPQISTNLTMTALKDQSVWTAVDAWCEGPTLASVLDTAPLPPERVRRLMTPVATGVAALHRERIVLRELHPESILVRGDDDCLLTDLELAKLLEVEATVSSHWTINPYRAPEVAGGVSRPQADLYSLARLLVHLTTGALPDYPDDARSVEQAIPAKTLSSLIARCLSPNWKKRPASVEDLLNLLPELGGGHG
jgi:hypothetical protein